MNKMIVTALISAAMVVSLPVWSHTDEYLDTVKAPHSGQLRMAGPYHLELVAKDNELVLYVTDHADKNINTDGGLGMANVQVGKAGTNISVELEPAGGNTFKGIEAFSVKPETVIVVFIKLPEQSAQTARFTPLKSYASSEETQDVHIHMDEHVEHHHHHN